LPDALGAAHVGDGLVQGVREHGGAVWIGSDLDGEELGPADEGETVGVGHTELRIEEKRGL